MKDFSQNGEQQIILDYFGEETGIFLDLGANDGSTLSNTRALSEKGWAGVCVEPAPGPYRKLKSLYDKDEYTQCINVAVSDYIGRATLFESGSHLKQGDTGLLSTLSLEETKRWKGTEEFNPVMVEVIDVPELLKRSFYTTFDFISIDCEGCDLTILRQMPLKELGTRMVCVEWNAREKLSYLDIMEPYGFRLIHENYENLIFAL